MDLKKFRLRLEISDIFVADYSDIMLNSLGVKRQE